MITVSNRFRKSYISIMSNLSTVC